MDDQLKPLKFKIYEEMCLKGAVVLGLSKEPQLRQLYDQNRQIFEHNADDLDEAHEL